MAAPLLFGEADLEGEILGESSDRCSYAPPRPVERDEPLRETREPFRVAVRDTMPESQRVTEPPSSLSASSIEEALERASDRPSGIRLSAPHSIEEAVLRVVERLQPLEPYEPLPRKIPKA